MKAITVKSLIWDKWNIEHIQKHDLTPRQAERVLHDENKVIQEAHSERFKVIGKGGKRMLTLILSAIGKKFYVVTARDLEAKERELYRKYGIKQIYDPT